MLAAGCWCTHCRCREVISCMARVHRFANKHTTSICANMHASKWGLLFRDCATNRRATTNRPTIRPTDALVQHYHGAERAYRNAAQLVGGRCAPARASARVQRRRLTNILHARTRAYTPCGFCTFNGIIASNFQAI